MTADLILDLRAELAEGPVWDPATSRLLFVNIMAGEVHEFDPSTGADRVLQVGEPVGVVSPTADGHLIAGLQSGFARIDRRTGTVTKLAAVEADRPDNRMNDGACDSRGRFWAGTLNMRHQREAAALYRLDPDGRVTRVLEHVTNSNGLDWSPDDTRMYYVDTGTGRVDVFAFDAMGGQLSGRRPFVTIPDADGHPDGLIVDAEGGVWVALWGGGVVNRYRPDGALDRQVRVPVSHPTKCAFGGPDLSDLFITTAWQGFTAEQRAAHPHAGGIFHCRPGVTGHPVRLFGA